MSSYICPIRCALMALSVVIPKAQRRVDVAPLMGRALRVFCLVCQHMLYKWGQVLAILGASRMFGDLLIVVDGWMDGWCAECSWLPQTDRTRNFGCVMAANRVRITIIPLTDDVRVFVCSMDWIYFLGYAAMPTMCVIWLLWLVQH